MADPAGSRAKKTLLRSSGVGTQADALGVLGDEYDAWTRTGRLGICEALVKLAANLQCVSYTTLANGTRLLVTVTTQVLMAI